MDNDEILWEGLKQGDKEMFLALYKKHYHSLLFIGLKEIKDSDLVKDTIQQLFLYLWEKREKIGDAKNVKAYLVTSFLRKLTSDWKKSHKAYNFQIVWNSHYEVPLPTPEENLIKKDESYYLSKQLMNHIDTLPARQKELIILKFYEGLTYEEIVQKTGLSRRTVYNKIHEAINKLKLGIASNQHSHSAALMLLVTLMASSAIIAGNQ